MSVAEQLDYRDIVRSSRCLADGRRMLQEPAVGVSDALAERHRVSPTQRAQTPDVEQLARRAVRLRRVEYQVGIGMDDLAHHFSELPNGEVLAGADVDVLRRVVVVHQKQ